MRRRALALIALASPGLAQRLVRNATIIRRTTISTSVFLPFTDDDGNVLCGNQPVRRVHDNSSLSHFSAMTWPSWLGRAVRNRHRYAIEQVSRDGAVKF